MKQFFAEYWLWILVPVLVVVFGLLCLMLAGGQAGSSSMDYAPF